MYRPSGATKNHLSCLFIIKIGKIKSHPGLYVIKTLKQIIYVNVTLFKGHINLSVIKEVPCFLSWNARGSKCVRKEEGQELNPVGHHIQEEQCIQHAKTDRRFDLSCIF